MYELKQTGDRSYYIDCPAKIGVYRQNDTDIYLIDSGNDKEAAKKILKIAAGRGWRIRGIVNTHSNADHIGGNRYLQQQTGCPVFAGGVEAAFTRHPVLEPSFLYGGYPCKELRSKFLLADESHVAGFDHPDFPSELEIIPLPGHFFDMVGVRTPDDTVFLADCVSSETTLAKYRISFIYDVARYLQTLDRVATLQAAVFVPSHAAATTDIGPLAAANRKAVEDTAADLLAVCREPVDPETILARMFDLYGLSMNIEQYVLAGSTLRSYLAWLKDNGKITFRFEKNRLLWQSSYGE